MKLSVNQNAKERQTYTTNTHIGYTYTRSVPLQVCFYFFTVINLHHYSPKHVNVDTWAPYVLLLQQKFSCNIHNLELIHHNLESC